MRNRAPGTEHHWIPLLHLGTGVAFCASMRQEPCPHSLNSPASIFVFWGRHMLQHGVVDSFTGITPDFTSVAHAALRATLTAGMNFGQRCLHPQSLADFDLSPRSTCGLNSWQLNRLIRSLRLPAIEELFEIMRKCAKDGDRA
jgi:hypothetical protein